MRTIAKHVARKPLVIANATDAQASGRNKQLRERFPARPAEPCWPRTDQTREGHHRLADLGAVRVREQDDSGCSAPRRRQAGGLVVDISR